MLTIISCFFVIAHFQLGLFSGIERKEESLPHTFDNEKYFFYIESEGISLIIEDSIQSLVTIEPFLLPLNQQDVNDDIAFAYIEPPQWQIKKLAQNTYQTYGRRVYAEEVKALLMDQFLPFNIRFRDNKGPQYSVHFQQNGNVMEPVQTVVNGEGSLMTVYFPTDELDFKQEATMEIVHQESGENVVFGVNFKNYLP